MRNIPNLKAEKLRVRFGPLASDVSAGNNGCFVLRRGLRHFVVQISDGRGWDHVSVSLPSRCPTWDEMCFFKDLFFRDDETVIQFHPPKSQYVNNCQYCLHLWRSQTVDTPLPDLELVGVLDEPTANPGSTS